MSCFCLCFVSFCVQIKPAEREERKDELVEAGFNLTELKVLATDYFKVNTQFLDFLTMYEQWLERKDCFLQNNHTHIQVRNNGNLQWHFHRVALDPLFPDRIGI